MHILIIFIAIFVSAPIISGREKLAGLSTRQGQCGAAWCYQEEEAESPNNATCGPDHWPDQTCRSGRQQSPIDLPAWSAHSHSTDSNKTLVMSKRYFTPSGFHVKNIGRTAEIRLNATDAYLSGSSLKGRYKLHGIHYHWGDRDDLGSEHTVDGKSYTMEMHMVHFREDFNNVQEAMSSGNKTALVVLAAFLNAHPSHRDHAGWSPIVKRIRRLRDAGEPEEGVNGNNLVLEALFDDMEDKYDIYQYQGSLTTPCCQEQVTWLIFRNPIPVTARQVREFRSLHYPNGNPMVNNYRPIQQSHGRSIEMVDCRMLKN